MGDLKNMRRNNMTVARGLGRPKSGRKNEGVYFDTLPPTLISPQSYVDSPSPFFFSGRHAFAACVFADNHPQIILARGHSRFDYCFDCSASFNLLILRLPPSFGFLHYNCVISNFRLRSTCRGHKPVLFRTFQTFSTSEQL